MEAWGGLDQLPGVPRKIVCTSGTLIPQALVQWPWFHTETLDMPSTKLLLICDKPMVSQKKIPSEFLLLKNYFSHLACARVPYQILLFHNIMVHFSHLSPYKCWEGSGKKKVLTSSALAPLCRVLLNPLCAQRQSWEGAVSLNISVVMCKDLRKEKISDLYEILEHLFYPPPRCHNQYIRALSTVFLPRPHRKSV